MKVDAPAVVILAHGQPSDPARAAAELTGFAARVAEYLPDRRVMAATLAQAGALAEAVAVAGPAAEVFPLFMAGGWFTRIHIPKRLAEVGAVGWRVLEPFGCDPALHDLAVQVVAEALAGQDFARAEVLIAAHGSSKSAVPSDIARHLVRLVEAAIRPARAEAAFIDQVPQLQAVAGFGAAAVCLPFFAAAGGHVTTDIPEALAKAGFGGRILPPLGLDQRVPQIVAQAIVRGAPVCAMRCRYQQG